MEKYESRLGPTQELVSPVLGQRTPVRIGSRAPKKGCPRRPIKNADDAAGCFKRRFLHHRPVVFPRREGQTVRSQYPPAPKKQLFRFCDQPRHTPSITVGLARVGGLHHRYEWQEAA
jgi:hypothetical protein